VFFNSIERLRNENNYRASTPFATSQDGLRSEEFCPDRRRSAHRQLSALSRQTEANCYSSSGTEPKPARARATHESSAKCRRALAGSKCTGGFGRSKKNNAAASKISRSAGSEPVAYFANSLATFALHGSCTDAIRKAPHRSVSLVSLLDPHCRHRVVCCRAPGGDVTCQHCNRTQEHDSTPKRQSIPRLHAK